MYSSETVSSKGKSAIEFSDEGNKIKTIFFITDERSPNVLGRDNFGKTTVKLERHI